MSEEEKVAIDPAATTFAVSKEVEPGTTVLVVRGELDLSTAPQLEESIQAVEGTAALVVDLSACDFIDSTGIALLVNTYREVDSSGRGMALCGLRDQVRRVLEIAGVEDLIPTRKTREEAISLLSG